MGLRSCGFCIRRTPGRDFSADVKHTDIHIEFSTIHVTRYGEAGI